MRVPLGWLREYCDPALETGELADVLSMRAVDVERIDRVGVPATEGYVIGKVVSASKHPNADRLSVCEVDTGDGTRTIVCGAPNVAQGQSVPVALPGAVLPDGRELGRAKLRGVVSDGMILSEAELEIGEDADGIMVLEEQLPATSSQRSGDPGSAGIRPGVWGPLVPGTPLVEVLPIAEHAFELEVNPNRVDLLGVYGVAREVHAVTGAELAPPPWSVDAETSGEREAAELASVSVEVPDLCPRFTARVFEGVEIGPSPAWMRARLIAAGQRPISNVVDVTNYVMLLTAQPLHAFDLDRVPGGEIRVRTAREGERLTTLDGVDRALDAETVLVCDREQATGIAGIMGGQVSEVSAATTRVLLEVANWNGVNILRTSGTLALRSEASTRFEKQLHPETTMWAQRVASRLLTEIAGARMMPGTIDQTGVIPAAHVISLHGARLDSLLGIEVVRDRAREHLEALEFEVSDAGPADLEATVPLHRHYDVTREADLIEEVGRLEGFDLLPRTLPRSAERIGRLSRDQRLRRRAEDVLADLGFDEIVAWHFERPDVADRLRLGDDDPRRRRIAISNPLSEEQTVMRSTLMGGLLDAAAHNLARGVERVALFESARVYLSEPTGGDGGTLAGQFLGGIGAPASERHRLAGLVVGALAPRSWAQHSAADGFFELKGALEALAGQLGVALFVTPGVETFLHPGRTGQVEIGGVKAGWLGELHPEVAESWDLPGGVAFEVDLAALVAASPAGRESFSGIPEFPAVLQDLAVVVGDDVPAARVRAAVAEGGGELLRSIRIFDVYRGEQTGEGSKSLAMRLSFRAHDRTLTDEEVATRRQAIADALGRIGGSLRE